MSVLEWYIPLGLMMLLLGVLIRRHAYDPAPWFFTYVTFGVVAGAGRFAVRSHQHLYYATYWITEAGYGLLGTLVMYEVLRASLRSLTRAWWTRLIFPAVLTAGFGLSFARAHAAPPQFDRALAFYILTGEIAVRFVQVFIFAGLVTLVPLLGLRWRQYSFGVATGFGLYATVVLLTTTKLSDFGTRFMFLWNITSLVAYSVAVLIWIWFFSAPQKTETPNPDVSAPSPGVLKQYLDVLRRMR